MNQKVLPKIDYTGDYQISDFIIHSIVLATPGAIERTILEIKDLLRKFKKNPPTINKKKQKMHV